MRVTQLPPQALCYDKIPGYESSRCQDDFEIWMHGWLFVLSSLDISWDSHIWLFQNPRSHAYRDKKWLQGTHDEPAGLFPCIALHAMCLALFSLVYHSFRVIDYV